MKKGQPLGGMKDPSFRFCQRCGHPAPASRSSMELKCGQCGFKHFINPLPAVVGILRDGGGCCSWRADLRQCWQSNVREGPGEWCSGVESGNCVCHAGWRCRERY